MACALGTHTAKRLEAWGQPDTNHAGVFNSAPQGPGPGRISEVQSLVRASEGGLTSGAAVLPRPPSFLLLLLEPLGIHSPGPRSRSRGWMVPQAESLVKLQPSRYTRWEGVWWLTL